MKDEQINELLYQALETELGGVQVYEAAVRCAVNDDLRKEWEEYLSQTKNHVQIVTDLFGKMELDATVDTPGRQIVREKAAALVRSMDMAQAAGDPSAAQLVAAEAVVDAETKDHQNWELIGTLAEELKRDTA
jgi:rubrerythrin